MGKTVRMTERELVRSLRKAFRAGRRKERAKFDKLLERHHQLKALNGTTELFKAAWEESDHPRDHGQFAEKEGGDTSGGDSAGGDAPAAPSREDRQAARDKRRESATDAREYHDLNAPSVDSGWHEDLSAEDHEKELAGHLEAYDAHHKVVRGHLEGAGASDRELAEFDRRVAKNRADVERKGKAAHAAKLKRDKALAALEDHRGLREDHEASEPEFPEDEEEPDEPEEEEYPEEPEEPVSEGHDGYPLDGPPKPEDYEPTPEGDAAFVFDREAWAKFDAEYDEFEKAHAAWKKEVAAVGKRNEAVRAGHDKAVAAVQSRNDAANAAHDRAFAAWDKTHDRLLSKESDLEDAHADAEEGHDGAAGEYAEEHADSLAHNGEHVSAVEDAVHGRVDAEEDADPEEDAVGKAWHEEDHNRDHGKFASNPGGGGSDQKPGSAPATGTNPSESKPAVRSDHHQPPIPEEHLLDGLHAEIPAGLWGQVKDKVVKAAKLIHEKMVLATPAFLRLQHILTRIESPEDLKTLGYTPLSGGVAGHETPDAFRDATGVGGTIGAKLVAHVLARVVHWMGKGLSAGEAVAKAIEEVMGGGDAATDTSDTTAADIDAIAPILSDVLAALAAEFGGEAPDAARVAEGLRGMAAQAAEPSTPAGTKFSYVGVTLRGPVLVGLEHVQSQIRDEDLGEDGREDDYHVTVRYGLHTEDAEDVRPVVAGFGPVRMTFGKPACFPGKDSGKDYDVIILPVVSEDLHRLHDTLGALPHTDTHPDYKPHATVAYVKAGLGEHYARTLGYARTTFREEAEEVVFSNREKARTVLPLVAGFDLWGEGDPHAEVLAAAVEHAERCAADGTDPTEGLRRLHALLPGAVGKAAARWSEDAHPRDDRGRFVARSAIKEAIKNPAKADALRARVTNPAERAKLDAVLGGDVHHSLLGDAKEVRAREEESKAKARELGTKILTRPNEATAQDYADLIPHLHAMTGAELSALRLKLGASFGGKRRVQERRDALIAYAEGKAEEHAAAIRDWSRVPAGSLFGSQRQRAIEDAKTRKDTDLANSPPIAANSPPIAANSEADAKTPLTPPSTATDIDAVPRSQRYGTPEEREAAAREMDALAAPRAANRAAALDLNDGAAVAAAAHDAAAKLPDWHGDPYAHDKHIPHKVYISRVYEAMNDRLPAGTSLEDFKAALSAHNRAGSLMLSPIDMPGASADFEAHKASESAGGLHAVELPRGARPARTETQPATGVGGAAGETPTDKARRYSGRS